MSPAKNYKNEIILEEYLKDRIKKCTIVKDQKVKNIYEELTINKDYNIHIKHCIPPYLPLP